MSTLAALARLLALLAGLLLPAALLAFFAALLVLLTTLVRILVRVFVCHLERLQVGPPIENRVTEETFLRDKIRTGARCLLT